jgi:peptidoglycan/xylan/chitin deacetylase (PgdA/CDA1 family)
MMKNKFWSLFVLLSIVHLSYAQSNNTWNGKRAAVVLTYDDGLNVHLSNTVPALDSAGLKGTFYIADYGNNLRTQIGGWRKAAARGHELANHTVWHPCEGGRPGREFVKGDYDLRFYTVRRMTDEIRTMNNLLKAIDGKVQRSFAFPCGDTKIGDTAYIDGLRNEFIAARGVSGVMPTLSEVDLFDFPGLMVNGESGDELIQLVKKAEEKGALLVFLFHGVGGEHGLDVSLPAHRQLLQYLRQKKKAIWVAPLIDVAKYVKNHRSKKKA